MAHGPDGDKIEVTMAADFKGDAVFNRGIVNAMGLEMEAGVRKYPQPTIGVVAKPEAGAGLREAIGKFKFF